MADAAFRFGFGLPPIFLSERARQLLSGGSVLIAVTGLHFALQFVAQTDLHRATITHHKLMFDWIDVTNNRTLGKTSQSGNGANKAGAAVYYSWRVSALTRLRHFQMAGVAVAVASLAAASLALASMTNRAELRRVLVYMGHLHMLLWLLAVISVVHVHRHTHIEQARFGRKYLDQHLTDALGNALWYYTYDISIKGYIDWLQQSLQCCGAVEFSDWFAVDWLPPSLYGRRYYFNLYMRQMMTDTGWKFYNLDQYGSVVTQRAMVPLLGESYATPAIKDQLFFGEVPFSCCDARFNGYCRQRLPHRHIFNYEPSERMAIHSEGCAVKLRQTLRRVVQWPALGIVALIAVLTVPLLLTRVVLTSQAEAVASGDTMCSTYGWLVPLRWGKHINNNNNNNSDDNNKQHTSEHSDAENNETQPLIPESDGNTTETRHEESDTD